MVNIKELKKDAKKLLKNNLWTLIFIGFFMSFIVGESAITKDGFENIKTVTKMIENFAHGEKQEFFNKNDQSTIINKYIDDIVSQFLFGEVKDLNKEFNVTNGVFYTIFDILMKQQLQFQNFIKSTVDYYNKIDLKTLLLFFGGFFGIMIKVFVINPVKVGETRIYLESKNYKKTRIKRLLYAFKKKNYLSFVSTMLTRDLYKLLWNFTIIGGIIKNYSYKMVEYIIAENPNISADDAILMSRVMMYGNKRNAFKLDLSFLGWVLLQYITFGVAGIYANPYYKSTYTSLYIKLREEYIKNKRYNYEVLNDVKLFEENDFEKYPIENYKEKKLANLKIDYNKNYRLTSLILFFFTFSFVGWLWEVALFLFKYGIFINRGTFYGPWLPIYGTGCTIIILFTKFKWFRKMLKNPILTFFIIMVICSVIEYGTSFYIEMTSGLRYWDYQGLFMNINGRICLEGAIFFGIGGSICIYFVAPLLEEVFQKITYEIKVPVCVALVLLFGLDVIYSHYFPHEGEGITTDVIQKK